MVNTAKYTARKTNKFKKALGGPKIGSLAGSLIAHPTTVKKAE